METENTETCMLPYSELICLLTPYVRAKGRVELSGDLWTYKPGANPLANAMFVNCLLFAFGEKGGG